MSNIFQQFVRGTDGSLPLNVGSGALATPHSNQGLNLDALGNIFSVLDGAISHYMNALPFDVNGRLVITAGAPSRFDQGIPFAASNAVSAASAGVIDHYDQGIGFTVTNAIPYTTLV